MFDPQIIFDETRTFLANRLKNVRQRSKFTSWLRVLTFLGFTACLIWLPFSPFQMALVLALAITFVAIFRYHEHLKKSTFRINARLAFIDTEMLRLKEEFDPLPDGRQFESAEHPYAKDLLLFGPASLFQRINRSQTLAGQSALAGWLMQNEFTPQESLSLQACAQEVAAKAAWTICFFGHPHRHEIDQLTGIGRPQWPHLASMRILLIQTALLACTVGAFFIANNWGWLALIGASSWTVWKNRQARRLLNKQSGMVKSVLLKTTDYLPMAMELQHEKFDNDLIQSIQKPLKGDDGFINQVKHLQKQTGRLFFTTADRFGSGSNLFFQIANNLLALEYHWIAGLFSWMNKNGGQLDGWIQNMARAEALLSMGLHAHARQAVDIYPTLSEDRFTVSGSEVGNPLLPLTSKTNPVTLTGKGRLELLTGSNMSGKSTYLRTIGINILLARLGMPVRAKTFTCYPHALFCSFSVQDDLIEGISAFLAEVKRLQQLVELIETNQQPIYFLDEILRGTNSTDRVNSTFELSRRLLASEAFGIITTHDLELAKKLEALIPDEQYYFESCVIDGELSFTYQRRKGVNPETNGYALLKKFKVI